MDDFLNVQKPSISHSETEVLNRFKRDVGNLSSLQESDKSDNNSSHILSITEIILTGTNENQVYVHWAGKDNNVSK